MSDDLDDLLRGAMKSLDGQVPSGYFEGLPNRTLARLGDSMQTTGTSGSERDPSSGVPPQGERDDDSGLHDIRSLASSTKARLSSRRSSTNPIVTDDDVLSSSSAGWKAVALPEPAKMVSLPELAALPTKREMKEKDQVARRAREAQELEDKAVAKAAAASKSARSTPVVAPAAELPVAAPPIAAIGSRIAEKHKPGQTGGHGKTIALVGVGLAAAAGAVIFFQMKSASEDKSATAGYKAKQLAPTPTMTAPMMDKAPAPPTVAAIVPDPAPVVAPPAAEPADPKIASNKNVETKQKVHKIEIRDTMKGELKPDVVKPPTPAKDDKKKDPDAGDPSFDALLKEAGVSDQKKDNKPKLDKKSLSGGDFKNGMGSISKKAQACFTGTQGTASVKLTVASSGQVSKVSVSGVFAGTPVASCVESAVKGASFPPWEGGPQTFSYSFLLSD